MRKTEIADKQQEFAYNKMVKLASHFHQVVSGFNRKGHKHLQDKVLQDIDEVTLMIHECDCTCVPLIEHLFNEVDTLLHISVELKLIEAEQALFCSKEMDRINGYLDEW